MRGRNGFMKKKCRKGRDVTELNERENKQEEKNAGGRNRNTS